VWKESLAVTVGDGNHIWWGRGYRDGCNWCGNGWRWV